jgi:hypothetical protein
MLDFRSELNILFQRRLFHQQRMQMIRQIITKRNVHLSDVPILNPFICYSGNDFVSQRHIRIQHFSSICERHPRQVHCTTPRAHNPHWRIKITVAKSSRQLGFFWHQLVIDSPVSSPPEDLPAPFHNNYARFMPCVYLDGSPIN